MTDPGVPGGTRLMWPWLFSTTHRQDALVVVDVERGEVDAQAIIGKVGLEADLIRSGFFARHANELRDLKGRGLNACGR
jgi:hypothetical protein